MQGFVVTIMLCPYLFCDCCDIPSVDVLYAIRMCYWKGVVEIVIVIIVLMRFPSLGI